MNAARVTRLVAGREVAEFVRERSLLTGTVMPIAVLAVVIVFLQVLEIGKSEFRVASAGGASEQVARAAQSYAIQSGRTILLERMPDDAAVRRAVSDGSADAGIVRGGAEIVADVRLDRGLAPALQRGAHAVRAGVQPPPPIAVRQEPHNLASTFGAALFGISLIYLQLLRWGYGVAARVLEERASRLIEVLLATIRPRELLVGKVAGFGAVGTLQLLVMLLAAAAIASAAGYGAIDSAVARAIAVAVVWFALGHVLFGAMYAVAGVMTGAHRPLQTVVAPLTSVIVLSYILTVFAVADPGGGLATVLSLVPLTAPMNAPARVLAGEMAAGQLALSFALLVAGAAVALALALRIYAGAAASVDPRPRLRDAWSRAAA